MFSSGITYMWWRYHHSKLSDDRGRLHFRVGWFSRKLPVEFRHLQTSYLSHVLRAVNMKSLFDIYLKSRKTQLNKTILSMFHIKTRDSNIRFHWKISGSHSNKQTWSNAGNAFIEFCSKYISFPPSRNTKYKQHIQYTYNVKFRLVSVTIFPVKIIEYYILGARVLP